MYDIFLIHPRVNEHLGCSQVLAIVNSAAMSTGMHVIFLNDSLAICPGAGLVGFLDHTVVLYLYF